MLAFYFLSSYFALGMFVNSIYLILFIGVAYVLEKPKKRVISNPELFD